MKRFFAGNAAMVIALALSTPAQANIFGPQEIRRWNMCDWEKIPEEVLLRIEKRSDYEDILRRMFDFCPDAALGFTDRPTATVSGEEDDDRKGREPDGEPESGPEGDGPEGDSPEGDGPEGDGPEGDGPEGDGPEGDGPEGDGPENEVDYGLPG